MKVLIYISWPVKAWCITDAHVATLRERFPDVAFLHAATQQDARRVIEDVDAGFTPFLTSEMVAAAPRLRWVHSSAALGLTQATRSCGGSPRSTLCSG